MIKNKDVMDCLLEILNIINKKTVTGYFDEENKTLVIGTKDKDNISQIFIVKPPQD